MKTELISDSVFEGSMLRRLDQTRELLQTAVSEWDALGYTPCTTTSQLFDVVYNAQMMIQEGRAQKEADSAGLSEAQREQYLKKLRHKDPMRYKLAAAAASQDPYAERGGGLWDIKSGKVVLNEEAAEPILKSRSVVCENDNQLAVGKKILKILELFNQVNKSTHGSLKLSLGDLFAQDLRPTDDAAPATLDLPTLRRILTFV